MKASSPVDPQPDSPPRPRLAVVLYAVLAADAVVFGASFAVFGLGVEGLLRAARYTARLSFLLFLIAFLAETLASWRPSPLTRLMLVNRRALGVGFAFAHFIHLGALTSYLWAAHKQPGVPFLIGGGVGYLFVALMVVSSDERGAGLFGPKAWARLQRFGGYYIWGVFAFSYLGRVTKKAPQEPRWIYATLLAMAVSALFLRRLVSFRRRRLRETGP